MKATASFSGVKAYVPGNGCAMQIRQTIAGLALASPMRPPFVKSRGYCSVTSIRAQLGSEFELRYTCRASCCLRPEVLLQYNAVLIDNKAHDA